MEARRNDRRIFGVPADMAEQDFAKVWVQLQETGRAEIEVPIEPLSFRQV